MLLTTHTKHARTLMAKEHGWGEETEKETRGGGGGVVCGIGQAWMERAEYKFVFI